MIIFANLSIYNDGSRSNFNIVRLFVMFVFCKYKINCLFVLPLIAYKFNVSRCVLLRSTLSSLAYIGVVFMFCLSWIISLIWAPLTNELSTSLQSKVKVWGIAPGTRIWEIFSSPWTVAMPPHRCWKISCKNQSSWSLSKSALKL